MPRLIDAHTEEKLELAELVDMLETGDFDGEDEENFASWGIQLRKLANDRNFLADMMIAELKQRCDGQVRDNQYGAQVVMLHGRSNKFIIRANLWPALKDSVVRHSGTNPFFYGVPHDHNFSFLTVGYLGPGYWSDYYEYEYDEVVGIPGEDVNLRFVEKAKLDEGKVMLYRAHRDIHLQLPADAMSVSLNIVETIAFVGVPRPVSLRPRKFEGRRHPDPDVAGADAGAGRPFRRRRRPRPSRHLRRQPSQRPHPLVRAALPRQRRADARRADRDLRGGRAHRQPAGQRDGVARGAEDRSRPRLDRRCAAEGSRGVRSSPANAGED